MPKFKWLKSSGKKQIQKPADVSDGGRNDRRGENDDPERNNVRNEEEEQRRRQDGTKLVYFSCGTPMDNIIDAIQVSQGNKEVNIYTDENECIQYITPITNKVFLIVDDIPPASLIEAIAPLKQIDSVFIYASSADAISEITKTPTSYLANWFDNDAMLQHGINKSREELEKQTAAFSMFNKKEKSTRDLSKESGSFLFFQLFKIVVKQMPKTDEAKKTMVTTCLNYYRGDKKELSNIDEFNRTYKAVEAIPWYTKESFLYKFVNKALRTEDVDVLYQLRFYILDLSEQLELKCDELKKTTKILKLYRGLKLSMDEVANFQKSIGNLISTNGYLSTSSEFTVAYGFATQSAKREGYARALFEYEVNLETTNKIVIADIREFSAFPEEAEVLVDIGASFQIDSCEYSADDDLWRVNVHATDQGADLAAEYIEYQKQKMVESNIVLMFGNLLLDMGEHSKAERYFDTLLSTANPNDEEIACIYFNFGRTHRLKGDFRRAASCYTRAYNLHMDARPKRLASAGKTLNGLGVVYVELGREKTAAECFRRAMQLYKMSIPKKHVDVAGTLINLGTIDCERQEYDKAVIKFQKAKKIYTSSLPPGHPNHALPSVNLGNVYLAAGKYQEAAIAYEEALEIQGKGLPADHPDIARTRNNLALVYTHLGEKEKAQENLERAEEIAGGMLTAKHPIMRKLNKTKIQMSEEADICIYTVH